MNPPAPGLKHPDDIALGKRIRQVRKAAGITRIQLAATLDISEQQVIKYETADTRVSYSRLKEICAALAIRVIDLLEPLEASRKPVKRRERD